MARHSVRRSRRIGVVESLEGRSLMSGNILGTDQALLPAVHVAQKVAPAAEIAQKVQKVAPADAIAQKV